MAARDEFKFGGEHDHTDGLASSGQFIEFHHLPTARNVLFKAFITDFDDDFQSEWNEEDAYGRMDPIATFKKTRRVISLSWDIPAASREEARENMRRCSLLIQMLYPTYEKVKGDSGASTIKSPPVFKLKFLNLIQDHGIDGGDNLALTAGLMGYLSGFKYKPEFDVGVIGPEGTPKKLYPKLIKASVKFSVLHQQELGWTEDGEQRTEFNKFPYSIDANESIDVTPVVLQDENSQQINSSKLDNTVAKNEERQTSQNSSQMLASNNALGGNR